jgi:hypothetical protein
LSNFGAYIGTDFLNKEFPERDWIIEGLLRKSDALLWVGQEKAGKTLISMQAFICCLTTGHPFIDKHNIPKPKRVTYILLEGDISESQDRIKRLSKTLDINPDNFVFMYYPHLQLQTRNGPYGLNHLLQEIKKYDCHDVVVIDPLYRAFSGSMVKDEVVREVVTNFDIIKDELNCALVVIHHTHKKKFDMKGDVIVEGDDATFGSVWFKAWASQIVLQTYNVKTGARGFYCTTQRSGDILKECELKLVEPNPLYFESIDKEPTMDLKIVELLKGENCNGGLKVEEIKERLKLSNSSFYRSIKQPLAQGMIIKSEIRPLKYSYNFERDKSAGLHLEKTCSKD